MSYLTMQPAVTTFKTEFDCHNQCESNNQSFGGVYYPDQSSHTYNSEPDHDLSLDDIAQIDWSQILRCESSEYHPHSSPTEDETDSVCLSDEDIAMINALPTTCTTNSSATELYHSNMQALDYSCMYQGQSDSSNCSDSSPESRLPSFKDLAIAINLHPDNGHGDYKSDEDDESEVICRKGKRGAKNVLLWKFLLDQLGERDQKHVRWIDVKDGTFRFVDTNEISRLWGSKKRKTDMNFEKLSRGIRHYYKTGFMSRQDGTRLVYRFNWNKVPKEYRRRFISR